MPHLRVQVLGSMNVTDASRRVLSVAGSCRPILGYLLTHRQREVPKAELADTLWSGRPGEHARRCLSTALWRLKKSACADVPLIAFGGSDRVGFNLTPRIWVDAIAMELRIRPLLKRPAHTLGPEQLRRLEQGVSLYQGDYLAGMEAEWACIERQRLRDLYCDGLYHLTMGHAARHDWGQVVAWGRRLCREEPLREDVHRLLMLACAHTGNRASALAQYELCRRVLAREVGVEPMAETQAVHRSLLRGAPAQSPVMPVPPASIEGITRRIGQVRRLMVVCQRRLDQAMDSLERIDHRDIGR